jgi:glucose uptake protein GlcU
MFKLDDYKFGVGVMWTNEGGYTLWVVAFVAGVLWSFGVCD